MTLFIITIYSNIPIYSRGCLPVLHKELKLIEAITERAVRQLLLWTCARSVRAEGADLIFGDHSSQH